MVCYLNERLALFDSTQKDTIKAAFNADFLPTRNKSENIYSDSFICLKQILETAAAVF